MHTRPLFLLLLTAVLTSCATASFSHYKGVGRIKRYDFYSSQLPASFEGFRMAFATDFHYESRFSRRRLDGLRHSREGGDCGTLPQLIAALEKKKEALK